MFDRDVPIPPISRARRYGPLNLQAMNPGDSQFRATPRGSKTVAAQVSRFAKNSGRSFTLRRIIEDGEEGVRIWRIN